jgi:peptidyl-prolyl cis-trans isomerase B (cyclophilin B)
MCNEMPWRNEKSRATFDGSTLIPKELFMPKAIMETSKGTINLDLFDKDAPGTVKNFVDLANKGFYNGLNFHRVIKDFMIQGGCPTGTGTGGPGYKIKCEINTQKHTPGTLSMAHAGKDTGGSQFFITHVSTPHLDGVHTVFGRTKDMDVVNAIKQGDKITSVKIVD